MSRRKNNLECNNCKSLKSNDPENDGSYCGFCGKNLYLKKTTKTWNPKQIKKFNKEFLR